MNVRARNIARVTAAGKAICLLAAIFTTASARPAWSAFRENLWGARPAALAGAFTATADDANAPAYNPAGVSLVPENEMTFMYAQLYTGLTLHLGQDDTSHLGLGYFSFIPRINDGKYGSYGISWTNFVASSLYREDTFALSVADSYQFETVNSRPIFSYGANLKMLRRSFYTDSRSDADPVFNGGHTSNAFTGDLGLMIQPNFRILPGLRFGVAGQNLTQPNIGLATTDRVPARYALGIAYHEARYPLFNPSIELSKRGGRAMVGAAWEAWVSPDVLALRVGGDADALSGGIGYNFDLFSKVRMKLDYAILWPLNVDGTNGSHRVSITTSF